MNYELRNKLLEEFNTTGAIIMKRSYMLPNVLDSLFYGFGSYIKNSIQFANLMELYSSNMPLLIKLLEYGKEDVKTLYNEKCAREVNLVKEVFAICRDYDSNKVDKNTMDELLTNKAEDYLQQIKPSWRFPNPFKR